MQKLASLMAKKTVGLKHSALTYLL